MSLPTDPAERHRAIAGRFSALTHAVSDWDAPSPVPEWRARDVVGHLVDWIDGFLASSSEVRLPATPSWVDDPVGAWAARAAGVQALLDDESTARLRFHNPHIGELAVPDAVDRFYTVDVFMHSWDLARASGQDDTLDPELATEMLAGMLPIDALLRASGQYGPAVPVSDDASAGDRLMAFVGRDPAWRPPA